MPVYEFRCRECNHIFEEPTRTADDCPVCAATDIARIYGNISMVVPKAFSNSPGGMTVREQQQQIYDGAREQGLDIQRVK